MAAVPIMIDGVFAPKDKMHPPMAGVFLGVAWNPDLGVGGGPVIPPGGPPLVPGWPEIPPYPGQLPPGTQPPHIWGPPGPWPTPPIAFPPGWVGGVPPVGGDGAHPEHPIVLPPDKPVDPDTGHTLVHVYVPGKGSVWFYVETPVPPPPEAGPKKA